MVYIGSGKLIGGPSKGKDCHFPFEYKGKKHYQCITEDSPINEPWCSASPIFSQDDFGYCDCSIRGNSKFKNYEQC